MEINILLGDSGSGFVDIGANTVPLMILHGKLEELVIQPKVPIGLMVESIVVIVMWLPFYVINNNNTMYASDKETDKESDTQRDDNSHMAENSTNAIGLQISGTRIRIVNYQARWYWCQNSSNSNYITI